MNNLRSAESASNTQQAFPVKERIKAILHTGFLDFHFLDSHEAAILLTLFSLNLAQGLYFF